MFVPIPDQLRKGVAKIPGRLTYEHFVTCCRALEDGRITVTEARTQMQYAIPKRPDLLELFVQWSTPIPANGMCFFFMRTVDLVSDLNHLDAALDVMRCALEIKHARYGSIPHPALFLRDFAAFQDAYNQLQNTEDRKKLACVFTDEQRIKQQHVGPVVYLPHTRKPKNTHSTIKQDDLDLSLAQLMEKVSLFSELYLQIRTQEMTWARKLKHANAEIQDDSVPDKIDSTADVTEAGMGVLLMATRF